jgi:hypothetical protein
VPLLVQDSIQWMFWLGLLSAAADVLVALWLANRNAQSSARTGVVPAQIAVAVDHRPKG